MTRLSTIEAEVVVLSALILPWHDSTRACERDVVGSSTLSFLRKAVAPGVDVDGGLDIGRFIVGVVDGRRGALFQRTFEDTVIDANRVGNESLQSIGTSNSSKLILDVLLESSIKLSSFGSVVPVQNNRDSPEVSYIGSRRTLLSESVELTLSRSNLIRVPKDSTEFLDE